MNSDSKCTTIGYNCQFRRICGLSQAAWSTPSRRRSNSRAIGLHSSHEPSEWSQWLWHNDSTVNTVVNSYYWAYCYYYYHYHWSDRKGDSCCKVSEHIIHMCHGTSRGTLMVRHVHLCICSKQNSTRVHFYSNKTKQAWLIYYHKSHHANHAVMYIAICLPVGLFPLTVLSHHHHQSRLTSWGINY